jgi:histidine triad (HIT) family protein
MTDCIFCKVIRGELPGKFVRKEKNWVAFYDVSPQAPVHILIVPTRHIESLQTVSSNDRNLLGDLMVAAHEIARDLSVDAGGYKIVINNGKQAGQIVMHLHMHLLGNLNKSPSFPV